MGNRFIGLSLSEDSYGTPKAIDFYIDVASESITDSQENIHVETAGFRSKQYSVPGPYKIEGSWDQMVTADNISRILDGLCGTTVAPVPSGDGAFRHRFYEAQTLKSYTMEIAPDVATSSRRVVGTFFRSVDFEAAAREVLTATVNVTGRKPMLIASSDPTGLWPTCRPFVFYEGTLYFNGIAVAYCEAFRLTYENDIDTDEYVLGDRYLPGMFVQGLNITGEMDIKFLDWDYYKYFWGNATATGPSTALSSCSLNLLFTGEATGSVAPGFENYVFQIEIPKVYLDTSEANFDRRDQIVQSLAFTALYDSVGYTSRFTLINGDPTA